MRRFLGLSAAVLLFASPASAELQITSRSSLVSATIDFGYVGSVTTTTDSYSYTSIDDVQLVRQGSASDGGPLGDISWDASYQYSLEQQLVPEGTHGLSGGASTNLFTFVGGDGVSFISSTNRLEVAFENTAETLFDLYFIATPGSRIDLEYESSPGFWEPVVTHPGGFEAIEQQTTLTPGDYRLLAETTAATDNGFSNGGSWSFSINPVPEPSTIALLAISAAGLFVLRRKS